jgi:biopolymer transport protein ExbD
MRLTRSLVATLALTCLVVTIACSSQSSVQPSQTRSSSGEIASVHVTAAGVITLNGNEVTLEQLKQEFARLAAVGGTVRYSRDNAAGDPHPNAMKVMQAIVDARLPIEMVMRP